MKPLLRIIIICLLLFTSCEKVTDQDYLLKYYGASYEDIGYSVTIVKDGYVIAGQLEDVHRNNDGYITSRNKNMGIIKTGWDGNEIWKVSIGGKNNDLGSKIYQNSDGSLVCVGTFTDTVFAASSQTDVFVAKISQQGTIEWQRTYGKKYGNQTGIDIIKTPDGYMVLGSTDVEAPSGSSSSGNIAGKTDILLLKIKENGDSTESFQYGFPGNDLGKVIKADQGDNYIVFATTDQSDPGQDKNNMLLVKINSVGYSTQKLFLGGTDDEYAGDMEVLSEGYLLAGNIGKNGESQKIQVIKLKNNIFDSPYFSKFITIADPLDPAIASCGVCSISLYNTGSYVLAGYSGIGSSANMMVFEMDGDGNPVAGHEVIKGSTGTQVAYDVAAGDDGYIIAVGKNSYDINSMITLLKFRF
jgi:hypothetical protein